METSPESSVLFSALQLCDKQTKEGMKKFAKSTVSKEEFQKTFNILTSTVNEIVNGLEFDNSSADKSHCRFEIATILTALSMREEFESEIDQECDLFIFIRQFTSINTELLFDLICACELEVAFVKVLESLSPDVGLKLISKFVDYISKSTVSLENDSSNVAGLFRSLIRYVFLHERGVLLQAFDGRNVNIQQSAWHVVESIVILVEKLLRENSDSVSNVIDSAPELMVGFLNIYGAALDKTVHTYDIITETKIVLWTPKDISCTEPDSSNQDSLHHVSNTLQYQKFADQYKVSPETYCDVMKMLFRNGVEKEIHHQTLGSGSQIFASTAKIFDPIERCMVELLRNAQLRETIILEIDYAQKSGNVLYASDTKWHLSCILGLVLRKIYKILSDLSTDQIEGLNSDEKDCKHMFEMLQNILTELKSEAWEPIFRSEIVSEESKFSRALVVIGEKLPNWESDINWILNECEMISDPRWIKCLLSSTEELVNFSNSRLLWKKLVLCSRNKKPEFAKATVDIRDLFLNVFQQHDAKDKNAILNHVFESNENLKLIFEIDKTRTFAKLTVLMNRLVEMESGADVISQIITIALQCPEEVLNHLVKNAVQNSKQCDIIVALFHEFVALAKFKTPKSNHAYIYDCIRNLLTNFEDFTEKQQRDFLYFIMKCVSRPKDENVFIPVKSEPRVEVQPADRRENTKPLLDFIDVWLYCINPEMTDVMEDCDETDMFYDETFEFCLKIIAALCNKNKYQLISSRGEQDPVVFVLLINMCELLFVWDMVTTPENVSLFDDCRKHILDTLSSLCELLEWNFNHKSDTFSPANFHWLCTKLELLPWHIKGYVLPVIQTYFNMDTARDYSMKQKLDLDFNVPQCVTTVLDLEGGCHMLVSSNVAENTNIWLPVLKLVIISDDFCTVVCNALRAEVLSEESYTLLVGALLETLSCCIDTEWVRVTTFLRAVCKKSLEKSDIAKSTRAGNQDRLEDETGFAWENVPESDPILILFDVVFMMLEQEGREIDTEAHIVKCFLRCFFTFLDSHSRQYIPNIASTGFHPSGVIKQVEQLGLDRITTFEYLIRMCLFVGRISDSVQEQVVGILLELVDICSKYSRENVYSEGNLDNRKLFKIVMRVAPKNVRNVLGKKLQEVGVTI